MINLDHMNYKYGTSYTEELPGGGFETRNVSEVLHLTKWEAIRMLMSTETYLWRWFANGDISRQDCWRSWCEVKERMYKLLRECEHAYLKQLGRNVGCPEWEPPSFQR